MTSQSQVITIGVIFLLLPTAFVVLRIWAKTMSRGGLAWDDFMIFGALLGQHQSHSPEGMPLLNDPRFLLYEKCKFALNMLTYVGYGFSKASILILYLRIFDVKAFRIWPQILLGVVGAWTVAFFLASLFQCYPISALIEPFYHRKCINGLPLWYTGGVTDIVIDFGILAMPVPMVLRLKLPGSRSWV
ncbi:uncharacterized protein KY384_004616 [Bacidia gigantensis]|uniref:uncharacterized protein n=1 Tax=Bacidia gigantensis TaxID=2732470 RepID=UPI001D05AC05|nr:uncharacterized protein KY384_004616 [Bacidia gigantensis]KAG8531258.1 hypothetical protein KY384_004616 [Bacidia gigantensis]